MKKILVLLISLNVYADCPKSIDTVVIGDSQVGATWSYSYIGNFLQQCLSGEFVIYGRGATVPRHWYGRGGLDHIETIQRDNENEHFNIGNKDKVPLCKKRLSHIISTHDPKRIVFNFGGNMIREKDSQIISQAKELISIVKKYNLKKEQCYFVTPTFEMEVRDRRNIPHRNLANVQRVSNLIKTTIIKDCQHLDGVEIMKDSPYYNGQDKLKRIPIAGRSGCMGAAQNDNVHICGEAAKDFANRICDHINF